MQANYQLTQAGLLYAVASTAKDAGHLLLTHMLKQHLAAPLSFTAVREFCNGDTETAFKLVCDFLDQGFIDIAETSEAKSACSANTGIGLLNTLFGSDEFVLSDMNGLPMLFNGLDRSQACQLSAIACDFIKVSRRTRHRYQGANVLQPVSIETDWQGKEVSILLLHLGGFSCLLASRNAAITEQRGFIHFVSSLCNRYDYERPR